jgi:hypothetical protein
MNKWIQITTIFTLLLTLTTIIQAQSELEPSKTPTEIPTEQEDTREEENNQVPRYTQEDLSILIGNVQRPNGFAWINNTLYTACNGDWTLYEIDDTSGDTQTFLFGIRNAHTLYAEETDAGFNLWIPDFDLNTIFLVNQSQTAAQPVAENIDSPWGIAYLDESRFLVTSLRENKILTVTRNGQSIDLVEDLSSPTGIAVENNEEDTLIYVGNTGSSRRSIEWLTLEETKPITLISGLRNVTGLTYAADNHLYFAYSLGTRGVIGRVNPTICREDECTAEDVEVILYTDLPAPLAGLAITPDMRLFTHTIYRPEIYWVQIEE